MKLNIKLIDKIVGLFILIAILGLVALIIILGINQRWFKKNYYFTSRFASANNLVAGMPITLSGFEIGQVDNITLNPLAKLVDIRFYIYEEFYETVVMPNSIIELVSSPIGLGSGLVFHPGKVEGAPVPPIPPESFIPAYNMPEGLELVSKDLVERAPTDDSIGSLVAQINPILQQVPPILFAVKSVLNDVGTAFKGTDKSELGRALANVTALLGTVDASVKNVDKILTGGDTGPVGNIIDNLSLASDDLNELIDRESRQIDLIMADLQGITSNLEKLTADPTGLAVQLIDPRGSLKTFLDDDNRLFSNVENMLNDVEQIVAELEKFARFISGTTPQISGILEEGKEALAQGQDVLEGLKNNPLLRGGISEKREEPDSFGSQRDEEF